MKRSEGLGITSNREGKETSLPVATKLKQPSKIDT